MSMSLATLKDIIARHPAEKPAIERLGRLLDKTGESYEVNRLYDLIKPTSQMALMAILADAVSSGLLDSYIVVESPFGGGIGEFTRLSEIPDELPDWRSEGEMVRIEPEQVHVRFRRTGGGSGR